MVSFKKETERLKLEASAGLWEYRQVSTNYLQDIKYETTASFGYSFTPALKLKYDLTIDRFEDWVVDPITSTNNKVVSSTYLNGIRLDHPLSESATVSLDYRYTNNYAPERQRYTENYYNNRVMVELTKQF
jgi:outer membrane protein assembly factor BamA